MLIEKIQQLIEMSKSHNWFYETYIKGRTQVTAFRSDTDIKRLPLFDLSHLTSASSLLSSCSNLEAVPPFDLSNCESFYYAFAGCKKIKSIPLINTSKSKNFQYTFSEDSALETIPQIDTSSGTSFSSMFYNCKALKEVPVLNTSNGGNFSNMFRGCSVLETIHGIDITNATSTSNMFTSSPELKDYTPIGSIGINFSMQYQNKLTAESAKKIICALVNYAGTEQEDKNTLYFPSAVWDLLNAEGDTAPHGGTWAEYVDLCGWNT